MDNFIYIMLLVFFYTSLFCGAVIVACGFLWAATKFAGYSWKSAVRWSWIIEAIHHYKNAFPERYEKACKYSGIKE